MELRRGDTVAFVREQPRGWCYVRLTIDPDSSYLSECDPCHALKLERLNFWLWVLRNLAIDSLIVAGQLLRAKLGRRPVPAPSWSGSV